MGYYTYYDRDFFKNSGWYPLSGEHYKELLRCCFRYSSYVSFLEMDSRHPFAAKLDKWKVQGGSAELDALCSADKRRIYAACEELHQEMLSWSDDLFSLYTLSDHQFPEDPMFIRCDGTIFFDSTIHEGECSIYPRAGENVEAVLSWGHWLYIDESGRPAVPAKEHQLPFPDYAEVKNNALFRKLWVIRVTPLDYLSEITIEALCDYIDRYRPPGNKLPEGFCCLPDWYFSFQMYILGELEALTFTRIPAAFEKRGISGEAGFYCFFKLLSQYMCLVRNPDRREKES